MLTPELITQLLVVAKSCEPREMCGLLFGETFHMTPNKAANPYNEFTIDHEDYLRTCMQHDGKPWGLVHSHVGKGAAPSVKDCALMDALQLANQDLAMVIVGLKPEEIRIFRKEGDLYTLQWHWPVKKK